MKAPVVAKSIPISSVIFHHGVLWWQHLQAFSELALFGGICAAKGESLSRSSFSSSDFSFGDMLLADCCCGVFSFDKNRPNKTPEKAAKRVRRRPGGWPEF